MEEKSKMTSVSRRAFLGTTAAAAAGFTIVPRHAVAGLGHKLRVTNSILPALVLEVWVSLT